MTGIITGYIIGHATGLNSGGQKIIQGGKEC